MISRDSEHDQLLHKINSRLTVVWGYLQLMEKSMKSEPETGWLKKISSEIQRLMEDLDKLKEKASQ